MVWKSSCDWVVSDFMILAVSWLALWQDAQWMVIIVVMVGSQTSVMLLIFRLFQLHVVDCTFYTYISVGRLIFFLSLMECVLSHRWKETLLPLKLIISHHG